MPREHDVPFYERIEEGGSDAWGWYLERRPDGWYVGDTFGERLIAAPTASYKTAYKRGAAVATRTNRQFVENAWNIRMPNEASARALYEILDAAHAPAPTAVARKLCVELGYRWDAEQRACLEDGLGAAVAEIKLVDLGVVVHRRDEWPYVGLSYGTRPKVATPDMIFHTTQDRVAADLLEQKWRQIEQGDKPAVEVFKLKGEVWIVDGHHALAAYLVHGVPPLLAVRGPGEYVVPAPRFVRKRKTLGDAPRFFHLADAADRASIDRHGLRPSKGWEQSGVYVTTNPEGWLLLFEDDGVYATTAVDVWEVDVSSYALEPDENETADPDEDFVVLGSLVPRSRLRLAATLTREVGSYVWRGPRVP